MGRRVVVDPLLAFGLGKEPFTRRLPYPKRGRGTPHLDTIIGGVVSSTLLTLLVLPVLYVLLANRKAKAHAPAPLPNAADEAPA